MRMRYLFILFMCTYGFSQHQEDYKEVYLKEFRLKFFKSYLKYAYENSDSINTVLSGDQSGYGEPILGEDYVYVDSLALVSVKNYNMKKKEGESPNDDKNVIFQTALDFYYSAWLEKIAKSRFARWKKLRNENVRVSH